MHIGPVPAKRKYLHLTVLGRLWALPAVRLPLHPPMLIVPPRLPTHAAVSVEGGLLHFAEIEYR